GTFMGTLSYIAPEVIQGQSATILSDLYSLGVVLYELVAGRPPFEGETITAILSQHLHAPVTPPSVHNERISGKLDDLIVRLLHKEAAKRPASAAMAAQMLGALLQAPDAAKPAVVDPLQRLVRGRLVGRERELAEAQTL
ncbi:MAG: protein kinase, partial [Candidatus Promineifilaceae bacterium]|nr:protein kinase [Candidatus Promineifilaceae bacterium]